MTIDMSTTRTDLALESVQAARSGAETGTISGVRSRERTREGYAVTDIRVEDEDGALALGKAKLPTHIEVAAQCCGLPKDSVILLEQIRTLDKRRLRERMGRVDGAVMERVDDAIAVSFGLPRSRLV